MQDDDKKHLTPEIAEFGAIVERHATAMNAGRFAEALSDMLAAFQIAADHPIDDSPLDRLRTLADQAIQQGDWDAAERLYLEKLAMEVASGEFAACTHSSLARLYQFLERSTNAMKHCRLAYELARDHEIEMVRVMCAIMFARIAFVNEQASEAELALRTSLASLPTQPMYSHLRAQALVEIANACRVRSDFFDARQLVDEAFGVLAPQQALQVLPGYQKTLARAWEVRAGIHTAAGDNKESAAAWENAIDWERRFQTCHCCFEEENPIDADEYRRFLYSAAESFRAVGNTVMANQLQSECDDIRRQWRLAPLDRR